MTARGYLIQYLSCSVSIVPIALPISAAPFVARPALVAALTVIAVPPVYSIRTTSGGPHAAMPDKVTNNSPDNRTPHATPRSRSKLETMFPYIRARIP
jgi:hypothetical protein